MGCARRDADADAPRCTRSGTAPATGPGDDYPVSIIGGKQVQPPSPAEILAARKAMHHKFMDGAQVSHAMRNGHVKVVENGKTRTLVMNATVFMNPSGEPISNQSFAAFAKDVNAYWGNLSFKGTDGYTYKTQLTINQYQGKDWPSADIQLGCAHVGNEGGEAYLKTGGIWLDSSNRDQITSGLGAHEFGHAFLGLDDAYKRTIFSNGYEIKGLVPYGWDNDIMAKTGGTVSASDLQALTISVPQMQTSGENKGR